MKKSKRSKKILELIGEETKTYAADEAIDLLKKCPKLKFDESLEISMKLGVDPKKADQQVRGVVSLPHGSGKAIKVLVLAKGPKIQEALDAGADYAGEQEFVDKIKEGWLDFNAIIATPDMMREVGKLGKILGPRSLMPSPKSGTVTADVAKAVKEIKAGKIEFKVDKNSGIHNIFGKLSFDTKKLKENLTALLSAIMKAKPSTSKGAYIKSLFVSSSQGPGLAIDIHSLNLSS